MGEHDLPDSIDALRLRRFMKALLADVRALERMIRDGMLETGMRRIGAEQEMFLVDEAGRPRNMALDVLARLDDPAFTTELAQFNLETNLSPQVFGSDCLRRMETELRENLLKARAAAESAGGGILLSGILPTLRKSDLTLDAMVPNPRYRQLNDAMAALRGGEFNFLIKGIDELETTHDNVMLESCNTSFQIHFQVAPHEFAKLYNVAQAITAPVLAAAVNSPILLGRRLWHETRIALFQQSVDARSKVHQNRGLRARVSFGCIGEWAKKAFGMQRAILRGKLWIDGVKIGFELWPVIAGCLHPDQQNRHPGGLGGLQYPLQIGAAGLGRQAAQQVIAPQRHDQRIDIGAEGPTDPRKPACRGIAGHTGIDHRDRMAARGKPALQLRHEPLFLHQAVTLGQAIAQGCDGDGLGTKRGRQQHRQHQRLAHQAQGPICDRPK